MIFMSYFEEFVIAYGLLQRFRFSVPAVRTLSAAVALSSLRGMVDDGDGWMECFAVRSLDHGHGHRCNKGQYFTTRTKSRWCYWSRRSEIRPNLEARCQMVDVENPPSTLTILYPS